MKNALIIFAKGIALTVMGLAGAAGFAIALIAAIFGLVFLAVFALIVCGMVCIITGESPTLSNLAEKEAD